MANTGQPVLLRIPTLSSEKFASDRAYWEDRARRYAGQGQGLAAVCSYGMPAFYNHAIQLTQMLALRPWLRTSSGKRVLDAGCGVGRWTRMMARNGAQVTAVDLSPTMIAEASRRGEQQGLTEKCRFLVQDLADLDAGDSYDLIVAVTVLQHILQPVRLENALSRLSRHLAPQGRMVLLEAAPTRRSSRCDTAIFRARSLDDYLSAFRKCGLYVEKITGVDPAPFKTWLLPYYRRLPAPVRAAALAMVTACSLPVDVIFGRACPQWSWHKVFVLRKESGSGHGR